MQQIKARLRKLEELESQRAVDQPSQQHEATQERTPPSQRRSSVASTEPVRHDFMSASYPVDTITEAQCCELMMKCRNLTFTAAVGSVEPPQPNGTFHCLLIPYGYVVVMVEQVMENFEQLELDHPTGEGEIQLVRVVGSTCLWQKEFIKLPNRTTLPPPAPTMSQGTPPPPPSSSSSGE
ncbi:hypothetical protein ZWY2020_048212 [Hordeum vulgare]|nr:hypothetical protein ZWY2020_048212 [Hordeum vulgare]